MKKTKHSEEKIIGAVKQLEAGRSVKEVARELGVTDQTCTTGNRSMAAWMSAMRSGGRHWKTRTGG